jgi:hypothetical protein
VIDLAAGRTTLTDEAPHLLTIAGWLLLEVLVRRAPNERELGGLAVSGRPTRAAVLRAASERDHEDALETVEPTRIARRAAR